MFIALFRTDWCLCQLVICIITVLQAGLQSVNTCHYNEEMRNEKRKRITDVRCHSPITGKVLHCNSVCTLSFSQPQSLLENFPINEFSSCQGFLRDRYTQDHDWCYRWNIGTKPNIEPNIEHAICNKKGILCINCSAIAVLDYVG